MADQKVTALTVTTAPVASDLVMLVDDVGGTPTSKKITRDDFLARAHGEMYITSGTGTQTLSAATWTLINQFNAEGANGDSKNTTPDNTNNRITAGVTGKYRVDWRVSFDSNTAADETDFRVYWNSVAQSHTMATVMASATERRSVSGFGIVDVTAAGNHFELYANITVGGGNVDITEASLIVTKIDDT